MDFIANAGTGAHRGVWHITDNIVLTVLAAKTETRNFGYGDYQYIYPEAQEWKGDAICGQVRGMRQGGYNWGRYRTVEGGKVVTYRANRPDVIIGLDGYIPGPLCSRCAKKAGIEDRL